MIAYLSRPSDSVGPYPAILMIHEAWGLNEQIKGVTRRYANEGFAAIAPNLFTRQSDLLTEKNIAKAMIPMFSMPHEKRNDPTAIQELMESMSETDRKVMVSLLPQSGQQAIRVNVIQMTQKAEKEGFDSLWVIERLYPQTSYPFTSDVYIAANTKRITLGTCVMVYSITPVVFPRFATHDVLSEERTTQ
jgi:hypothetical protein